MKITNCTTHNKSILKYGRITSDNRRSELVRNTHSCTELKHSTKFHFEILLQHTLGATISTNNPAKQHLFQEKHFNITP